LQQPQLAAQARLSTGDLVSVVPENDIAARRMTTCEVASDGLAVRLGFVDASGQHCTIALPIDCLSSLLMTLPGLATAALRVQHGDPSLRIVYPLEKFRLESVAGDPAAILTLTTADGFEVSFGLCPQTALALHAATDVDRGSLARLQ
jgi:hypothetical protein